MTDPVQKIAEEAAWRALRASPAYEMIEGLAQAILQIREEQRQGWAPVLESKTI